MEHDKIKQMMCKLRKNCESCRKSLLPARIACFFLLLIFTFAILTGCSDSPPANGGASTATESSPVGNGDSSGPPGNGEIVEPSFYVGLPGEREERFSLAYAKAEDLTLNPFLHEEKTNFFEPYDLIYERLLRYSKAEGKYESGILESISISDRQVVLLIKG